MENKIDVTIENAIPLFGWMSESELTFLARLSSENKIVIEVGSWHGRSTRALGDNTIGVVYAVDHWKGSVNEQIPHQSAQLLDGDHAFIEFMNNNFDLVEMGKIVPIRMSSANAAAFLQKKGIKADVIFIDGGHTYDEVLKDIKDWCPLLKENGLICGHDYSDSFKGVKDAVHHIFGGDVTVRPNTTIWYTRPSSVVIEEKTKVVLCEDHADVTVGIPTKNRYDFLSHTLSSIIISSKVKPREIIIVDDSDEPIDLTKHPIYARILRKADEYKIRWEVIFGVKKGQHHSHQIIQEKANCSLIYRIDDDEIAEADTLGLLYDSMSDESIGAVAPLVLMETSFPELIPANADNKINKPNLPNIQWFKGWEGVREAEHLHSSFIYRKGIANYEMCLSPVAFREETIFTHEIYRAGYKLLVNSAAVVWHMKSATGGTRSYGELDTKNSYAYDEAVFNGYLNLWNYNENIRYVILDCGLGDHFAFESILPELKKKYKRIAIAACYAEVFDGYHYDTQIEIISIRQAKEVFGNIEYFSIYHNMQKWKWEGKLVDAFKKLYL